ncbi:MAG: DUF2267 domain-containing protein [Rubrobacter sp.]|nr:DUF2267 domain-containing protein [Rubrobacter sp.]
MQYAEFLKQVQDQIGPVHGSATSDEASCAIAVTLETLGECITSEEARNLADQLPKELKEPLQQASEDAKVCSLEAFLRRISEKEDVDAGMATDHASAVMSVLAEAVGGGEMEAIRAQLPQGFAALFR